MKSRFPRAVSIGVRNVAGPIRRVLCENLSVLLQVETDSAYELIREGFIGEGRAYGRGVFIKNAGLHLDVFSSPTDSGAN